MYLYSAPNRAVYSPLPPRKLAPGKKEGSFLSEKDEWARLGALALLFLANAAVILLLQGR